MHVRTGRVELARGTWAVVERLGLSDLLRRLPGDRAAITLSEPDHVDDLLDLLRELVGGRVGSV